MQPKNRAAALFDARARSKEARAARPRRCWERRGAATFKAQIAEKEAGSCAEAEPYARLS